MRDHYDQHLPCCPRDRAKQYREDRGGREAKPREGGQGLSINGG